MPLLRSCGPCSGVLCVLLLALVAFTAVVHANEEAAWREQMQKMSPESRAKFVCVSKCPEESRTSCSMKCLSTPCYERIYGTEDLPEDAFTQELRDTFEKCLVEEMRQSKLAASGQHQRRAAAAAAVPEVDAKVVRSRRRVKKKKK